MTQFSFPPDVEEQWSGLIMNEFVPFEIFTLYQEAIDISINQTKRGDMANLFTLNWEYK